MKCYTSRDYTELMVYRGKYPHWSKKLVDMLANLTWWIYAVNTRKEDRTLKPKDFLPKYNKSKRRQSQAEMEFIARSLCRIVDNGDDSNPSSKGNR